MAAGRKLLSQRERRWGANDGAAAAEISAAMERVRIREISEEASQRKLEKDHADGLDGPRPCVCLGGKNILGLPQQGWANKVINWQTK